MYKSPISHVGPHHHVVETVVFDMGCNLFHSLNSYLGIYNIFDALGLLARVFWLWLRT